MVCLAVTAVSMLGRFDGTNIKTMCGRRRQVEYVLHDGLPLFAMWLYASI